MLKCHVHPPSFLAPSYIPAAVLVDLLVVQGPSLTVFQHAQALQFHPGTDKEQVI